MATITINGRTYCGDSVSVANGAVTIDDVAQDRRRDSGRTARGRG